MKVTFTKVDVKRYEITIVREHGPALLPRYGPGYDDLMPHDLAHYLVEESYGIQLGVWGQLAAGGGGIFTPAPWDNSLANKKRTQRIGAIGRGDMVRSEQLVQLTVATWERGVGRNKHQIPAYVEFGAEDLDKAVRRMSAVAERWSSLQHGGSIEFSWPARLTFNPAKSQRGRRLSARTSVAARN